MKILILRFSRIGDCVLASPVVEALRERYPTAHLTWGVQSKAESMVRGLADLDETLLWSDHEPRARSLSRSLWRTRKARFDVVLDLNGANKAGYFMMASGAKRRITGSDSSPLTLRSSTECVQDGPRETTHVRDFFLHRAAALDIAPDANQRFFSRLPLGAEHHRFADDFCAQAASNAKNRIIGLNLGASNLAKRWPPQFFARLATDILRDDKHARIVVFGAPADKLLYEEMAKEIGEIRGAASDVDIANRVYNLVGKASLLQLAALSARCAAFVTADTGPMHIAAAVGAPIVALFGPTPVARFHPVHKPGSAPFRVLDGQKISGLDKAPMETHSVESVLRAVREIRELMR